MSNKTDLQALNESYAALIEELKGKAAGGGSGGSGSVATCTVTLNAMEEITVFFNVLDSNGGITVVNPTWTSDRFTASVSVSGVICDSSISMMGVYTPYIGGSAELVYNTMGCTIIKAPNVSGEECFISF